MEEIKNKFRGEFKKVPIDKVQSNNWNPKESIEDNLDNMQRYQQIKSNIVKKGMYIPIIVRQVADIFEIIDGYHRWRACRELGYTEIMVWDLGIISKEEAQGITLDGIYLIIPASEPMTAQIVKEISLVNPPALKLLPFNDIQIEEYKKLAEFDWNQYKDNEILESGNKKEVTCPKCGEKFTI